MVCINIKQNATGITINRTKMNEIKWMIGYNGIKLNWLNGKF